MSHVLATMVTYHIRTMEAIVAPEMHVIPITVVVALPTSRFAISTSIQMYIAAVLQDTTDLLTAQIVPAKPSMRAVLVMAAAT